MHPIKKLKQRLANFSDLLFLSLAVAIGIIVRFANMAKASIWHDEGFTMMLAPQSPGQIIARTARDVHPPLYYLTLHYWMKLFGLSEIGARSLSAVCMLGVIIFGFLLIRELFGRPAARLSALFLALGPFLVRYSQEARMYGMAAFIVVLATYLLVKALRTNQPWFWVGYSLAVAAGLYTHYYIIFVIALHWLYVLLIRMPKPAIKNPRWWLSNTASAIIFAPWLPSAYHQFTRVQGAFWIPKPTAQTLPSTIAQFLTFTNLDNLGSLARIVIFLIIVGLAFWFMTKKKLFPENALLVGLTFLAPILVLILSLKRPIYVDRYFVFAAAGFYMLLAVLLYTLKPWANKLGLRTLTALLLVVVFGYGIHDVYAQATHRMKLVGQYVDSGFKPGDEIISGELYTYFDFSYYNHTNTTSKLLSPNGVDGYGESSLLYDRANQILVKSFLDANPASGRVWVIGKPGDNGDFKVPSTWRLLDQYEASDSKVEHFQI